MISHRMAIAEREALEFYAAFFHLSDCPGTKITIDAISTTALIDGYLFITVTADSPATFYHLGNYTQWYNRFPSLLKDAFTNQVEKIFG